MASDSFEFEIKVDASSPAQAAVAVERLAKQLEGAESAAASAAEAVRAQEAVYRGAESAANRAALAHEKITQRLDEQRVALAKVAAGKDGVVNVGAYQRAALKVAELTKRQSEAADAATKAKAALDAETASLDKMRSAAATATAAQDRIKKAQEAAKKTADALEKTKPTGNFGKIGGELANFGGPLGAIAQKAFSAADSLGDLSEAAGSAGPYAAAAVAIVAVATAVATLTAAAIAGIAAISSWAVQLADGARTARLLSDGIAGTVAGGRELDATIKRLGSVVPQTREELLQMAADLAKTGLKGKELGDALESAAIKAAQAKFGPDFQKQTLSLTNQTARLKANLTSLFAGLKIEKLLEGFSRLVDLFDETSVTGRAIKVVFESLFQPLIDGVVEWIPKMERGFIQFEILVLKALIAIKPFGSQILWVAEVFGVLAAIVALMTVGFMVAVITPFAIIIGLAATLVAAVMEVINTFRNFYTTLSSMSLAEIGTAMIQGLANGITGAGGAVLSAITGVVTGAIGAAKNLLGIASPSKVFAEIGGYTAEGMAGGVDDGAKDVQGSLEAMVAPPTEAAAGAGAPAAGGGGGPSFAGLTIVVQSNGDDPQSQGAAIWEALENLVAQGGKAVPA